MRFRRWVERYLLIAQARLSSATGWFTAPWIYATVLFGWLFILGQTRTNPDGIAGFNLASGAQSLWLLTEGESPSPSLLDGESYLAQTAAYVIYPISILTRIFPTVGTILFLQALALSIAIVPLFYIARQLGKLHFGTSTAIVVAYGTYVSVHNLNLSGFSPTILALPAIFGVIYMGLSSNVGSSFASRRGWRFYLIYVALLLWILACRADLGLALAGFGALLFFEKGNPDSRKLIGRKLIGDRINLGFLTFIIGFGWLVLAVLVVQEQLGDGSPAIEAFRSYGSNPISVVGGMITSPVDVINDLRASQNFEGIVLLLAPLLFLPLIRPRYILPVIPLYFFYLVGDTPVDTLGEAAQTVPLIAFLFTAAVFALNRIGYILVERVRVNFYLVWLLVLVSLTFFIQDSASSFYEEPWRWNDRDQGIEEVLDNVPPEASVRASSSVLSNLAERAELYQLKTNSGNPELDAGRAIENVDWVIVDSEIEFQDDSSDIQEFEAELRSRGWMRVDAGEGVFAYKNSG